MRRLEPIACRWGSRNCPRSINNGRLGVAQKLKRLPQATLIQAARLAAFHSKARGAGQVEVIVTQRRQVKKGKNLPPGMVRVQRHESVQVPPTNPFDAEV